MSIENINIIKATFQAYANSVEVREGTMPMDVQDVEKEGKIVGVRLVSPIFPTSQYLYCPDGDGVNKADYVAGFVFPGDDAAFTSQMALDVANAVRSAIPTLPTILTGVIAPKYHEHGVSMITDPDEVNLIHHEVTLRRAEAIHLMREAEADQTKAPEAPTEG